MADPFKTKLVPKNPEPEPRFPADLPGKGGFRASGKAMAAEGYTVLDRADPRDSFERNRRGLTRPAYEDGPNVAWDEEF